MSGTGSTWIINGPLSAGGAPDLQLGPGTGTVNIADGGIVRATGGVTLAPEAGSFGTLNIGAAPGSPPVTPGTLNSPTVTFGGGTGAINFNHTATDYVFAPTISGLGALNQLAGTTVLRAADTYTGATTISGGTLVVNGSLGDTSVIGGAWDADRHRFDCRSGDGREWWHPERRRLNRRASDDR